MNLTGEEKTQLSQYLLGQLGELERDAVEDRFIADDRYHEELEHLEDNLIRRYLKEKLSPGEKVAFERHYGATTALWDKVEDMAQLLAVAAPRNSPKIMASPRNRQSKHS